MGIRFTNIVMIIMSFFAQETLVVGDLSHQKVSLIYLFLSNERIQTFMEGALLNIVLVRVEGLTKLIKQGAQMTRLITFRECFKDVNFTLVHDRCGCSKFNSHRVKNVHMMWRLSQGVKICKGKGVLFKL